MEKHNDEIAALESWNSGKPYEQSAKTEVPGLARLFRYYAGEYIQLSYYMINIYMLIVQLFCIRCILCIFFS